MGRERVGEALRAAARHRPADPVRAQREHEAERRAGRAAQRQHRVGGSSRRAARARARPRSASGPARWPSGGRSAPKRAISSGWRGGPQRAEQLAHQSSSASRTSGSNSAGRPARPGRGRGRRLDRALEHHRGAVVERMGQRRVGVHQLEAVVARAAGCSGTARRAPARGPSSRRRARSRAGSAPRSGSRRRRLGALEHGHRAARLRQRDRRGQPVRAGADDDRVVGVCSGNRAVALEQALQRPPGRPERVERRADRGAVPDVAPLDHWRFLSTHTTWVSTSASMPEVGGERGQRVLPEAVLLPWPPRVSPSSKIGSLARISTCACATVSPSRSRGAEGDPAGEHVALGRHQRERLLVRVEHHHAGGELHLARAGVMFEQRHLAGLDAR